MSSQATVVTHSKSLKLATAGEVLRSCAGRLTWKIVGATLAIAIALQAWFAIEFDLLSTTASQDAGLRATSNILVAYCVMFATLCADEAVDRGANRLRAYGWAVIMGTAVAALIQLLVRPLLPWSGATSSPVTHIVQAASVFLEYLLWAAIIVMVYANRRTALLASARMNAAQVQRADLQRRMLELQLQALQARVEPAFLFSTLLHMRELYDIHPARGAQMADDLIVYLRAVLPQMRDSNSTLGHELELAAAYLRIKQPAKPLARPETAAAPEALRARVPFMMLLPLVDHMLSADRNPLQPSSTIEIFVTAQAGALRVAVSDRDAIGVVQDGCGVLRDIRERLHALYGERGKLHVGSSSDGARIVLEIPYEASA